MTDRLLSKCQIKTIQALFYHLIRVSQSRATQNRCVHKREREKQCSCLLTVFPFVNDFLISVTPRYFPWQTGSFNWFWVYCWTVSSPAETWNRFLLNQFSYCWQNVFKCGYILWSHATIRCCTPSLAIVLIVFAVIKLLLAQLHSSCYCRFLFFSLSVSSVTWKPDCCRSVIFLAAGKPAINKAQKFSTALTAV